MYHLIDEKRRLYACNVAEITLEDSYCILQSWGGEHSLSEVLVFYSVTQNAVVINENCKDFNSIVKFCRGFLDADAETLEDVEASNLEGNTWELVCRVLLEARGMMDFKDNMDMLSHQKPGKEYNLMDWRTYNHLMQEQQFFKIFQYGVIMGKRTERARRAK